MADTGLREKTRNNKNRKILQEIIFKYLEEFQGDSERAKNIREHVLQYADYLNIERYFERALAVVGKLKQLDRDGYDFSDRSDAKTVTLSLTQAGRKKDDSGFYTCISGLIGNVHKKVGALRIVAYNQEYDCLDYFYIPKKEIAGLVGNLRDKKIRIRFRKSKGDYNIEKFRVSSFEEMAKKRSKSSKSSKRFKA